MAIESMAWRNYNIRSVNRWLFLYIRVFKKLINDTYANYVMQKVFEYGTPEVRN